MKENEIYTRLGLENKEELMELLDLSDRIQKIKYFCPSIDIKTAQPVRLTLRNGNFFEIAGIDNNRIQRLKCSRKGWETVLKSNNIPNNLYPLRNTPNKFPKGNIPKGYGSEWYFHRGHVFARQFHNSVSGYQVIQHNGNNSKNWDDSFIDNKDDNLFTQFSSANQIQAKIEAEVFALLSENQNVYYEVKLIFKNINDTYPIGTEIFYLPISSPEKFKHYFIPNTDLDFDLSILHEEDSKLSYPDFYKNGYREEYRKYFKNSDRNEIEVTENIGIGSNDFYLVLKPKEEAIYRFDTKLLNDLEEKKIKIFDEKDIDNILENPSNILIFSYKDAKIVHANLLKKSKISKSNKKNYYYFVLEDEPVIYLQYGHNEGKNVTHYGIENIMEGIEKLMGKEN